LIRPNTFPFFLLNNGRKGLTSGLAYQGLASAKSGSGNRKKLLKAPAASITFGHHHTDFLDWIVVEK